MDWWGIAWLGVLLLINAFFVGAEFAVISARRSQIEPLAAAGSRAARTTLWAMEHATLMLATSQLGITICSLLILDFSEPAIHHGIEGVLGSTSIPAEVVTVVSFLVALVLVTFLHVVFGEMIPKNLSFSVPDRAALLLAPPLVLVSRLAHPLIFVLNMMANGVLRAVRVEPKAEAASSFTLDEVAGIVQQSTREGMLVDAAGTLAGAFEFTEKLVSDVDVPLADMVLLPTDVTPSRIRSEVIRHGYSRYVVADDSGEPRGYIHMKDVIDLEGDQYEQPVPSKRIRQLGAVPRSAELEAALASMRRRGSHVARTVDDAGTTTGMIFLEDILEVLVGEVEDATSA